MKRNASLILLTILCAGSVAALLTLCAGASNASTSMAGQGLALADGRKTVSTAGTAEALAATQELYSLSITALESNSGTVVVGSSTVVAAVGTRRGRPLAPGETMVLSGDVSDAWKRIDPADVYIDAVTSGDGVSWVAITSD